MAEHYDASAPPPPQRSVTEDLNRLAWQDADRRLEARLEDLSETAELIREHDRAQGDELPDWLREDFELIAGADDAPIVFASLHRRVQEEFLTWDELYRHPSQSDGGIDLIAEALRRRSDERQTTLAVLREERRASLD